MSESGHSVYILYNEERKKTYVGITKDINRRIARHNNQLPHKKSSYTYRQSGRWIVIYQEKYANIITARNREKWFKGGVGREFISSHMAEWVRSSTGDPPSADF